MKDLIDKYRVNELTPVELSELRNRVNVMNDAELNPYLYEAWTDEKINTAAVNDDVVNRIKCGVDARIDRKRPALSLILRWSQIAAAILLPVSILFSIYFYRESSQILSEELYVTTGKAERANITLPDGTTVTLNVESKLGYLPKNYNKRERKINFSGEGYFNVYRNSEIPFCIHAKGLKVKVLGTVFNLSVREEADMAVLTLEEGSVLLLSTLSNKSVTLHDNQKAVLDQSTGEISVYDDENIRDMSDWKRGNMIFRNARLSDVIRSIEENYNVTIKIADEKDFADTFTGTLPVNDLNEALEIIERSFYLKSVLNRNGIEMKNN